MSSAVARNCLRFESASTSWGQNERQRAFEQNGARDNPAEAVLLLARSLLRRTHDVAAERVGLARKSTARLNSRDLFTSYTSSDFTTPRSREVSMNYGAGRIKGSPAATASGTRNFIFTQAA